MPRGVYNRSKDKKNGISHHKNGKSRAPKNGVEVVEVADKGSIRLEDLTRMNLLRLQAEVSSHESKFKLEQMALSQYISTIDPQRRIQGFEANINALKQKVGELLKEYRLEMQIISEKYGINMSEYSFDEQSGTLFAHPVPVPPAGIPQVPPSNSSSKN